MEHIKQMKRIEDALMQRIDELNQIEENLLENPLRNIGDLDKVRNEIEDLVKKLDESIEHRELLEKSI